MSDIDVFDVISHASVTCWVLGFDIMVLSYSLLVPTNNVNIPIETGSAEYIGSNVFLTAAHLFSLDTPVTNSFGDSYIMHTYYATDNGKVATIDGSNVNSFSYIDGWLPSNNVPKISPLKKNGDLASVASDAGANSGNPIPVLLFADEAKATSFFHKIGIYPFLDQ